MAIGRSAAAVSLLAIGLVRTARADVSPNMAGNATGVFRRFWDFPITSIRQVPLTVGTLAIAVVLLVAGYWVSRLLSRAIASLFAARFKIQPGLSSSIRTLTFYILFTFFAVTSLGLVNFPMTAFTVVGGALAIGVGFGSQNVMNNFISGLILNVERPVRVGDFVQIEEVTGTIERIGARSTIIRASNNSQVIVPNSFFLENRVMNYTLSDDVVRIQLNVGVGYESPVEEVRTILRDEIARHPRLLREFDQHVVFADFGEKALQFEAYFWVHARSILEQREILSDLRFRISDRFRAAGIAIAFAQSDVHLHGAPLDVRVVKDDAH